MKGKSHITVYMGLLYGRMYPRKRVIIMTLDQDSAKQTRKRLAEVNGGARPFNVKVKVV
jgi:hypothetical protein